MLPEGADLAPLRHALQLLAPLLPAPAAAAPNSSSASRVPVSALPSQQQAVQPAQQAAQPARPPQRQQRERTWDPPRERNTQASRVCRCDWG